MKKNNKLQFHEAETYAISLDVVYTEGGLQNSINFLFQILKKYYPITRIFAGFREVSVPAFYPIADTSDFSYDAIVMKHSLHEDPSQMHFFTISDSLEPYFDSINDDSEHSSHGIGRKDDYNSHMRIPLFFHGQRVFHIALCSNFKEIFEKDDLEKMKIITSKLAGSLQKTYQKIIYAKFEVDKQQSSVELLSMCKGISYLVEDLKKIARTEFTTIIYGETGVGKDLIAQSIHTLSSRKDKALIKVNCAAINENLLESELFGYEKGAFTGAQSRRKGFFEAAEGGTIFLDEIGELSLRLQSSLLRVVENKCIQKVGSTQEIPVDVRIVAATNRNLEKCVEEGTFRADLWYRLNTYPLEIPPLRQHREDIPILVHYFAQRGLQSIGVENLPLISNDEINKLYNHRWPGNIRELKNTVERAIIQANNGKYCNPLKFEINAIEKTNHSQKALTVELLPMEQVCQNHAREVLTFTQGKITGKNGAASILGLHPNTVRQYKDRIK